MSCPPPVQVSRPLLAVLLITSLQATASPNESSLRLSQRARPAAATAELAQPAALELGVGDVLRLQVIGRPEMSSLLYVESDGSIAVPLAGSVAVAGLSPATAGDRVAAALRKAQILVNPQVSLVVEQMRSQRISVLGQVRSAGRFAVDSRTTLIDALAQAGGTTEAAGDSVYVLRTEGDGSVQRISVDLGGLVDGAAAGNTMLLRPGDSVIVPEAEQFYIYGEVRSPNKYRVERGMTIVQAISRGGGLTLRGSDRRVEIQRRNSVGTMDRLDGKLTDRVQPNDVIRVKERLF